jgi:hypothetical protein
VRRRYWLLPLTALLWPSAVMRLAERAGSFAESAGVGLGTLQRVPVASASMPAAPAWTTDPGVALGGFEQLPGDAPVFQHAPVFQADTPSLGRSASTKSKRRANSVANRAIVQPATVAPKLGIRVPAKTVLRLANARAVPQGTFVSAEAGRPAGMRLNGVSAYGVGLRDGDVLTHVAGAPATSRSQVVSAVLQARAVRAPAVSAIFWREGEPWRLLVEMPYLQGG